MSRCPLSIPCFVAAAAFVLAAAPACGDGEPATPDAAQPPDAMVAFAFTTTAFDDGGSVPLRYECGGQLQGPGENISPALAWTAGPAGTMSYAITMIDVDTGVIHWVMYDIAGSVRDVAENVPAGYQPAFPAGAKQAELQGSNYYGYFGPCSPNSINTYEWTLHAIPTNSLTGVTQASTEQQSVTAVEAASIGSVSFTGES
jgi:hypothetical protein